MADHSSTDSYSLSYDPLVAWFKSHGEAFQTRAQEKLYARELRTRSLFPTHNEHSELIAALCWIFTRSEPGEALSEVVKTRLRSVAREHRRHGFPNTLFVDFSEILNETLRELATSLEDELLLPASQVFEEIGATLSEAAHEADLAGIPQAWVGQVVDITRHNRRLSSVILSSGYPFDYQAGQSLPVTSNYLRGHWRYLTPANPVSTYGTLELHIRIIDGGRASRFFASPRVGDLWTFGSPTGYVRLPVGPCILIAFGVGYASAKALIQAAAGTQRAPVHLVLVGEYPGDIYDWPVISALAQSISWLTVEAAAFNAPTPWWLNPLAEPENVTIYRDLDALIDVLAQRPEEFLITGPSNPVSQALLSLGQCGIPWSKIAIQRYSSTPRWN